LFSSFLWQETRDIAKAKQKLLGNDDTVPPFNFDSLPLDRNDSIWDRIETKYGLTLPELSALKNAKCSGVKKKEILNLKKK
jgi:hypothetical protein